MPRVFGEVTLREDAWDPMMWIYLVGSGLHPLLAREFAPLAQRLASVTGRLEGIPTIVADARATIGSVPERPVSRLHAEIAGKRIGGVADLGRQAVETAEAAAPTDAAVALLLPRLRAASDAAAEALAELGRYLADEVAPAATGGAALGEALFAEKLRHTLRDPEITPAAILARAEAEFAAVRAEMVRIARDAWPAWCGDRPIPDDEGALVRGVLDAIAADHPAADELVPYSRDELVRVEAFCRDREVIGLVDEPLRDRLDARVHALVRRRDAGLARAARPGPEDVLLDHARARRLAARAGRVVPARDEHAPDVAARDPRGGARATTCRWSTRTGARRWRGACSGPGCSPRAGRSTSPR